MPHFVRRYSGLPQLMHFTSMVVLGGTRMAWFTYKVYPFQFLWRAEASIFYSVAIWEECSLI